MTHPAPEDEARAQRQMRLCQEMAELGMQIARAAAAQALAALTPQTTTSNAAPTPAPTSDPAILFTRVTRTVRQAMMLESRIAADLRAQPLPLPSDSRRPPLRRLFHDAAHQTGRPELKAEAYERLDIELAEDPRASASDILATICESLGLELPQEIIARDPVGSVWPTIRRAAPGHAPGPPAPAQAAPAKPAASAKTDPALLSLWATISQQALREQDRRT